MAWQLTEKLDFISYDKPVHGYSEWSFGDRAMVSLSEYNHGKKSALDEAESVFLERITDPGLDTVIIEGISVYGETMLKVYIRDDQTEIRWGK